MLYYLTSDLIVEPESASYSDVIAAVTNIAIAVFERKHELRGEYNALEFFAKCEGLDLRSRLVVKNILTNYETKTIPAEISYYVEVVVNVTIRKRLNGKYIVTQIPACKLKDSQSTQASCLIGEYYYDCQFYRKILHWYKTINTITTPIRFEDVSGNGDTIVEHIKQYLKRDKRPCLCIVDTDKKYPSQPIREGTTCGKCAGKYVEDVLYKCIHLNVQEVENLIPLDIIDAQKWKGPFSSVNKDSFDKLRGNSNSEMILAFFDIKEGIKKNEMLINDPEYRTFAKLCCACDPNNAANTDFDGHLDSIPDGSVIYNMLCNNLLKNAIEYMKNNPGLDPSLMEFQKVEWLKIAKAMLNWGICRNEESLN